MSFRETYEESRARYLRTYNDEEARNYDRWVLTLTDEDHQACLDDLRDHVQFPAGIRVLDAGAGSGGLCLALSRIEGIELTALEPCPAMARLFAEKPQLSGISMVEGFCDHPSDRPLFPPNSFDLIASRQLANCLYDPLAAFRNWYHWLKPSGSVVVMDGMYKRSDWGGVWEGAVDALPLSACQSTAMVPYLLEQAGFEVEHAALMHATNLRPAMRTTRYIAVARKPLVESTV